uniref:Galectin n=1 Tax=Meloidogyne hapla TaxID=6305 RepID=A0A1I8AXB2_MELHA
MNGGMELMQYARHDYEIPIPPYRSYRKDMIDLKMNGTILCFVGKVLSSENMANTSVNSFEVTLLHDTKSGYESNSSLRIESYLNKDVFLKNPIGQTGVPIVLLIYAEKFYYNISVNGGDFINYKNGLPPWAAHYVMINGSISDVNFHDDDNNLEGCQKIINKLPPQFKFSKDLLLLKKDLVKNDEIIITGKIPNPFNETISVNFLNGAFKWHHKS